MKFLDEQTRLHYKSEISAIATMLEVISNRKDDLMSGAGTFMKAQLLRALNDKL